MEKAFQLLRNLPKVTLQNLRPLPGTRHKKRKPRGQHSGGRCGRAQGGQVQRNTLPKLGFEGGQFPFVLRIPKEPYYKGHHVRRQYPPLSLTRLQRTIDLGLLNTEEPIDLTSICNTKIISILPEQLHYGINLTDEGADIFAAKINIEVQAADEGAIAAIERSGGVITTRYFDALSVQALVDPVKFFGKGIPIPHCKLPPTDAIDYYSDPKNRGYLADPEKVAECRYELSQKYGYKLPDLTEDPKLPLMLMRKDPRQIWHGLWPGWLVNLQDKVIIKPKEPEYEEYYKS